MKKTIQLISVFFLATLLLAGCGGGSSSSDPLTPPPSGGGGGGGGTGGGGDGGGTGGGDGGTGGGDPTGPTTGPLDAGGTGVTTGQVDDGTGTAVTATFTNALDVNDLNQIIGFAEVTAGAPFSAALWSVDGNGDASAAPRALSSLTQNGFAAAFAIDEVGSPVGQAADGTRLVAVIWPSGATTPTPLPPLAAAGNYAALDISADGTLIVGAAADGTGRTRAVLWVADAQGEFTAAPTVLPFAAFARGGEQSRFSSAAGVARAGATEILVVGEAEAGDGTLHAALWRSTNNGATFTARDLGTDLIAYAVNGAGEVVGESDLDLSPVLWTIDAQGVASAPTSLAAAGSAVAINDDGRIAGWSGASSRATVWNGTTAATLFTTESQAYGLNNDLQPLVVGRNGSQGFVKRVE